MSEPVNARRPEGRLGRAQWLDAALTMVVRTGVAGLKVQELAASLGATTGSLYWHFRDRRDLLRALIEHWGERSTEQIAHEIEGLATPPEDRMLRLMELIEENEPTSGDVAIRAFAAHDPEAAESVARVDARRAQIVGGLFREMGFTGTELAMRTRLLLCYESCERLVFSEIPRAERKLLLIARHRMLCRR